MNIIKKIFGSKQNVQKKTWTPLNGYPIADAKGGLLPRFSSTSAGSAYLSAYEVNSFVYACVSTIIQATVSGILKLKTADGQVVEYKKRGTNPLLDLLYRPNPAMSWADFIQYCAGMQHLTGQVYILKTQKDSSDKPTELLPVAPYCVEIIKDARGFPSQYKVKFGSKTEIFDKEDVFTFKFWNPHDPLQGLPPLAACAKDVNILDAAKNFNEAFFANGATAGGYLTTEQPLSPQVRAELTAKWNDAHQGVVKSHRTAVLGYGLQYNDLETSHKDMQFTEGISINKQDIYSAFQVPPALVGLYEHAPQFNTKEQQKIFLQTKIIPFAKSWMDVFGERLVPDFYPNEDHYLDMDYSNNEALSEGVADKAQAFQTYVNVYGANKAKTALNLPFEDIEGGDEPPDVMMSAFGNLKAPQTGAKGIFAAKKYVRPSRQQRKAKNIAKQQLAESYAPQLASAVDKHFAAQREQIAAWIAANPTELPTYQNVFKNPDIEALKTAQLKAPIISEMFTAGIELEQDFMRRMLPSKNFKFKDAKAMRDRVAEWVQNNAFAWFEGAENTTLNELDAIIQTGLQEGLSNHQIQNRVLQFFSKEGYEPAGTITDSLGRHSTIYSRVQTIVQTETLGTMSEASLESYKSTPYVSGKGWVSAAGVIDHHPGHAEMSGQEVPVNANFINPVTLRETQGPGQFDEVGENINCLCDIYPVVLETQQEQQ